MCIKSKAFLIFIIPLIIIINVSESLETVTTPPEDFENSKCTLTQEFNDNIKGYQSDVNKIIDYFINGPFKGFTYQSLSEFVDKFGSRLAGSENLENAIDYMISKSNEYGLRDVHTENVEVPYWRRGEEYAVMIKPRMKNLAMLGLGYSVATPEDGITANAIVVKSFEELNALSDDEVRNKIVVYNEVFTTYGETVKYRSKGASMASRKGAVAALIRSITPFSINSPHTGMQTYDKNVTKIPVAAITLEDADLLWRLQQRGENIVIKLKMSATITTKISRNTIIDLKGTSERDKIVVISGHIDSWDVGDGAMDDGGGAFISWVAPIALQKLNLTTKRTLRSILWTSEELGLIGAVAYEKLHRQQNENLVFVMESDIGTFTPQGLTYKGSKIGACMLQEVMNLFSSINATKLIVGQPGSDIDVWLDQGIPGGELLNDNSKYFWYHHSEGDTINVLDSDTLDKVAAYWTGLSYVIADMDAAIPSLYKLNR